MHDRPRNERRHARELEILQGPGIGPLFAAASGCDNRA